MKLEENRKKYSFDAISSYRTEIMGFAALWIWIFHAWIPVMDNVSLLDVIENYIRRTGFYGVDIFFFLSGMGLTYASKKYSCGTFYKKRFLRVLPPLFITGLIACVARGTGFIGYVKMVTGYSFLAENIYETIWYIQAIIILYLIFPPYYRLSLIAKRKFIVVGGTLILWFAASVLLQDIMRGDLYGFTNRIPVFIIGIWMGWGLQNNTLKPSAAKWIVCGVVFVFGVILSYLTNYRGMQLLVPDSKSFLPSCMMAVSGSMLLSGGLWLLDKRCHMLFRVARKGLGFFGKRSLEFYCVQEILLGNIVGVYLDKRFSGIIANAGSFVIAVIITVILHEIFKRIPKLFDKKNCVSE